MKINFAVFGATVAGTFVAGTLSVTPAEAANIVGESGIVGFARTVEAGTTTNFSSFSVNDPIATDGVLGMFDTVTVNTLTIEDSDGDNIYDFANHDDLQTLEEKVLPYDFLAENCTFVGD